MRILALDLSSSTGWAAGSTDGTPVSHGIVKLPKSGEDIGRFLFAFREWMGAAIEELAPAEIVFESPILPAAVSLATARKLYSLAGLTELVALDYKIAVSEAHMQQVRKHFLGVARAPSDIPKDKRRQWIKARVIAACRERGFKVAGDDDADAIALLDYALSLKRPAHALQATPLFKGVAA